MPDSAAADSNVQQVGAYMRETREARGVTLDQAASVTRIPKNYLAAIEEGTFEKLPNVVYAKGFLRSYANFLGLSSDEMVALYVQALASGNASHLEQAGQHNEALFAAEKPDRRPDNGIRWYVSLLMLVLVITVAYFFKGAEQGPVLPAPASSQSRQLSVPPLLQPRRSSAGLPVEAIRATVPAGKQDKPAPAIINQPSGGIFLRLKVNHDSRLNITIDGEISQQYDLKAGDLIEWKGEKFFTLDMDNAGGVEAEFNGRPLKSLGEPGTSAHLVLRGDTPGGPETARKTPAP